MLSAVSDDFHFLFLLDSFIKNFFMKIKLRDLVKEQASRPYMHLVLLF